MIQRILAQKIIGLAKSFPVVAIMGPRQSGKTTLARSLFKDFQYVSLEDFDTRLFAEEDPRGFLATYQNGAILDEVQKVPKLFSYLQTHVDERKRSSQFILTGSQNFLLHEKISQSLAGRVALLKLLPLSLEELKDSPHEFQTPDDYIFHGFYPRLYAEKIEPRDWYPSYIQTYLERDVRDIKHIGDLSLFQKFIKLCAGRAGQLLNLSSLASECGITHNTAKSWISLLEASFIIFLLQPYHKNISTRVVKTPKLYFYDTGLLSSLLGIEHKEQLSSHYLRGSLFENFIIAELIKYRLNRGLEPHLFFWRDKAGHEIDCLLERADQFIPVEIKSGKTVLASYFDNIGYWHSVAPKSSSLPYVIYGGDQDQKRSSIHLLSWKNMFSIPSLA